MYRHRLSGMEVRMTFSVYDKSAVRAYMMLYATMVKKEWYAGNFIRLEPAGKAGWHAFVTPSGLMARDWIKRKAEA